MKEGGSIIAKVLKNTKYFMNKYGLFYEGEILYKYCQNDGKLYFDKTVVLDKFIVHHDKIYRNKQQLYFRFYPEGRKDKHYMFTINTDQLGIFYKKVLTK